MLLQRASSRWLVEGLATLTERERATTRHGTGDLDLGERSKQIASTWTSTRGA